MYAREFRNQLRESLDKYVEHMESEGKGPNRESDEWFSDFTEFLSENGGDGTPTSLMDLFNIATGGDSGDEDEED